MGGAFRVAGGYVRRERLYAARLARVRRDRGGVAAESRRKAAPSFDQESNRRVLVFQKKQSVQNLAGVPIAFAAQAHHPDANPFL